ncbi:hypothetical protein FKM82_030903 [Ascaphus truei]
MLNPRPLSLRTRQVESLWMASRSPSPSAQGAVPPCFSRRLYSASGRRGVTVIGFSGSTIRSRSTLMETDVPELRRASTAA